MRDDDTCHLWQNYEDYCPVSIDNLAAMPTVRCFKCANWDCERNNCALIIDLFAKKKTAT
jgi:hypothetical protein